MSDFSKFEGESSKTIKLSVDEYENIRLDKFIADNVNNLSRSKIVELIENGNITVNGRHVLKSYNTKLSDEINIIIPEVEECKIMPEDIPLKIVYEDGDLLVVNKPKNMVVHPSNGHYQGTLVNALLNHCKESLSGINGVARPGIVHRIDKNTSGLLIVAKNDYSHVKLSEQIKGHYFKRIYHAVVYGRLKNDEGIVDLPIGRSKYDRKKMSVTYKNSKPARTIYEKIEDFGKFTYVKLMLQTGRTHQIRVHMAYIGHPVAGDDVYGPQKVIKELNGQCLHAKVIGFVHPTKNVYMEFDSDLPDYFQKFLSKCKNF